MFRSTGCNWRAVCSSLVLILTAGVLVVPVQASVHLTDPAGTLDQIFGTSMTELEDLNGDGHWEFLIGAPGDPAGSEHGKVFFWFGGTALTAEADHTWTGSPGEKFGWAVARIGDVNDGGVADWAVGAPLADNVATNAGRVYVFYGESDHETGSDPDLTIDGEIAGDQFGFAISAAGDFDGDGRDDFIVGAPYNDLSGIQAGAAYVIYGASGGPSNDLSDATVLTGGSASGLFGWSVSDAGNFLGGNPDCVAVGAPLDDTYGIDAGGLYVFEGVIPPAVPNATIDFTTGTSYTLNPADSQYGFAVRGINRWNSDGYDDLAVGAPWSNASALEAGRVEIVFGGLTPTPSNDPFVNGEVAYDHFGYALARVHDVTGSSADDLLIGAPLHNGGATDTGKAYLYAGGSPSYASAASLEALAADPIPGQNVANDLFGWAVSSAGFFDGDEVPDLAVGAPGGNIASGAVAGYGWLQDSAGDVVPTFLLSWRAVWQTPDQVALDFNLGLSVDQIALVTIGRQFHWSDNQTTLGAVVFEGPVTLDSYDSYGQLSWDIAGYHLVYTETEPVPEDAELGYWLLVLTQSGDKIDLKYLAGPGQQPPEPSVGEILSLDPVWPNPCNPQANVRFRARSGQFVRCRVTDVRGRLVQELYAGQANGDWQTLVWDGRNAHGQSVPSGAYLIVLEAEQRSLLRRVSLTR